MPTIPVTVRRRYACAHGTRNKRSAQLMRGAIAAFIDWGVPTCVVPARASAPTAPRGLRVCGATSPPAHVARQTIRHACCGVSAKISQPPRSGSFGRCFAGRCATRPTIRARSWRSRARCDGAPSAKHCSRSGSLPRRCCWSERGGAQSGRELFGRCFGHPRVMRPISLSVVALVIVGALGTMIGCASGDTAVTGTGGSKGTGGSSNSGGTTGTGGTPSTGGTTGTGGTPATGGVTGSGGVVATGGVQGTGGAPNTGGTTGTGGVQGTGGTPSTGGTTGTAGTTGTGGTPSTGGVTGTGGTPSTGGTTGTAGSGGFGQPICGSNSAGTAIAKSVACTATDPQLCYKTCGPASIGVKSETCTTGAYAEMSGCSFDPSVNYTCYKVPATLDASCPTTTPQAGQACTVASCVVCNVAGMYLDTSSAMKTGYCVCQASGKWTCAATNAWPCPGGTGC